MATIRYSTSVSICEDTSKTFELYDLLKQADPNYTATSPIQIQLYVFDGTKYVQVTSGYFTAVDLDTLLLDMASKPDFNGNLQVRVNGTDSTGNTFVLDLGVVVKPVNDAPSGADDSFTVANGDVHVFALNDFHFTDVVENDGFKSVVITTPPASGSLLLNGVPVVAGQEILAADIAAGSLTYVAPTNSGGVIGFEFQVRDTGGLANCNAADLDATPNTIIFNVPQPSDPALLGDRVWEDTNGNGIQDAGEAGIAGVIVELRDGTGSVVGTTTTDGNGNYSFSVAPGTYSVAILPPSGYFVTGQDLGGNEATDSDVDNSGLSGQVTVTAGQSNLDVDAGLYRSVQLGDLVWIDSNANGQQDAGEAGVPGVRVTLLDANGNPVGGSQITDVNGNYLFTGLPPGTYSVQFDKTTLPANYIFTTANSGADASDSDADATTGQTAQVTLFSGDSNLTLDAGIKAKPGTITGSVLEDVDNNDTGNIPIPGVTVTLVDSNGNVVGTTTTDQNGNYTFTDVPPGNYTLVETNLPGYLDVGDADGGNPNTTTPVTVNPGQTTTVGPFVDERPATIGDTVWLDANANGLQDAGEAGIPGVTVQVKDSTGIVVGTAITDTNGNYSFTVAPGTYSVTVTTPSGFVATSANQGTNDAIDSDFVNGASSPITVLGGTSNPTIDAGYYQMASLGDRVWLDSNANGVQDSGEAGVAGVTVQLLNAAGNVVSTLTTGTNGDYLFTNLVPGTYSIRVVAPNGYAFTTQDAGGNDATDSDVNATGQSAQTALTSGEIDRSWDAGLVAKLGTITGTVREDIDNNNTGDVGIPGVTVVLVNSAGTTVATTTTDTNGYYVFTGVPAGNYTVVEQNNPGYLDVSDIDGGNPNSIAVTVTPGQTSSGNDFVDERPASIGDRVWFDTNGNGLQDTGELGAAGVTVKLLDAGGNVVVTTTTDASGNYLFSNLSAGQYAVQVVAPTGYKFTTANAGTNDAIDSDFTWDGTGKSTGTTALITVNSGDAIRTVDAGVKLCLVNLGDKVWLDANNNGVQDTGEAGLAGVKVTLTGAGADNTFGTADDTKATTTTDSNGNYLFSNVGWGSYKVGIDLPTGYQLTTANVGTNDGVDSDFMAKTSTTTSTSTTTTNLIVNGSFENTGSTANYLQVSSIQGWKGLGDLLEVSTASSYGVTGATGSNVLELDARTTGTTGTGIYQDVQTVAGQTYTLSLDVAARIGSALSTNTVEVWWGNTKIATIDPTSTTFKTYTYTVTGTGGLDRLSFREQYCDDNGIGGIIDNVKLLGTTTTTTTTTTNVYETDTIVVNSCDDNLTIDAGLYQKASLGDRVWFDTNGNGLQDTGEAGAAGVTVKLLDAGGNVVATTTTDASGNYLFSNLDPGQYAVQVVAPSGYKFTTANAGTNDAIDSDFTWDGTGTSTGTTALITLNSGDAIRTVDAGVKVCLVNLGDKVWLDADADGVQDAGEAGLDGVKVTLTGAGADNTFGTADDTTATTTTDANGNYLFSNVGWGSYKVGITMTTGYQLTAANVGSNDAVDSDFKSKAVTTTGTSTTITNLIVNGSFENTGAAAGAFVQANSIQGWTGLGDVLEVAGSSSYGVTGATGSNVLELDARTTCTTGTGVYQDVQTVCGQTYTLSLDVAARSGTALWTNSVEVWWGNIRIATIEPTSTTFKTYSFTVTGTGCLDRLSFREQCGDDDNVGGIIDNVKLLCTTTTTTTTTSNVYETDTIVVNSCDDNLSIDAGLTPVSAKASIGNLVWEDLNFNGIQDAGEAGIAGVTVKLLNSAGTVVSTTLTDSTGKYLFSNLNAGDYRVQVVAPSGYYTTKQDQGTNDAVDSDIDSTGKTVLTTLSAGENDLSWDAGLYRKASIGDRVWEDSNHNSVQDAGESGIANVKVWLWNDATQSWSSTYTDTNGNYKFVNLDPGVYQIAFDKSATVYWGIDMSTWYWGTKNVGNNDNIDADVYSTNDVAYTDWISLSSGEVDLSWDAAITPIVIDLNGDGINTISRESSTGSFDLLGTGTAISSGWISSADAFLAVDSNGNGKVDNISELFGGNKQGEGFAKLASYDSNGDGVVDADDAGFASLLVWQDLNGNHQSDAGELRSLVEAGVESLKVDFVELPAVDASGNLHLERSSATLVGGQQVDMSDIYLNVSVDDAEAAGIELPSLAALLGDDSSLDAILGGTAPSAPVPAPIPESMVATLNQLASLYEQQQHELLAA